MIYQGLGKSFYAVVAARFVNRFGDFVYFLLVMLLSIKLGLDERLVGIVSTINFLSALFGQLFGGFISDRLSRSRLLPLFQFLVASCYLIAIPFLSPINRDAVIALILLSSFFRGAVYPMTNALTADLVGEDKRNEAYSLLYLITNGGVALGSVIAGILFDHLILLFVLSAAMLILDAIITRAFVPYIKPQKKNKASHRNADNSNISFIALFSFIGIVYCYMYQSTTFILPLEIKDIFGAAKGPKYYSYISFFNALAVIVFTSFVTAFTRGRKATSNMALGMVFYAAGLISFAFSFSLSLFIVSMVIWTMGEILMATNTNVYLNNKVSSESRGLFNSIYIAAQSLGSAIAPTISGMLLGHFSYSAMWIVLSVLSILITFSYLSFGKKY